MHVLLSALSRFTAPTGICRHSANLAMCLADSDAVSRISLVLGRWQERYFRECLNVESPKIVVVPVDVPNNSLSRNRWFVSGLPRLAGELAPDLVHLSFPVPVIRSFFAAPVVATIHDLYPYDYPAVFGRADAFVKRLLFRRCIRACDGFACVSRATIAALETRVGRLLADKPVALVNNYVEIPRDVVTAKPAAMDDRPFILTVAQHQGNKRIDLLLHAFGRLVANGEAASGEHRDPLRTSGFSCPPALRPGTRLVVAGRPGRETGKLKQLCAALGLDEHVVWLEGLPDSELGWLYDHCDLFVVCSWIEGFCIPLAEALAHSCRIVCSDIPTLREVADDTCTFFEITRAPIANLAAAITDRLAAPLPPKDAVNRFPRSLTSSQCMALYRDVRLRGGEAVDRRPAAAPTTITAGVQRRQS